MNRVRFLTVFFAAAVASVTGASGQEVRLSVSADSVLVGERFFATIAVDLDAGYRGIFPDLSGVVFGAGDVEFIRPVEIATASDYSVTHTDSATYEITAFGIDSVFVGGLPVKIISPYGDTLDSASPSVLVGIQSVVPKDAAGTRDLAALATFPALIWPWVLGGIGLLIAAALAYYLWKRTQGQSIATGTQMEPRVDPYDEAVRRLRRLSEQNPATDEEVREYFIELSDTLRSYLEYTIKVPALERTSAELMLALRRLSAVSIDLLGEKTIGRIGKSLDVSDLAKFAGYRPGRVENTEVLELTRQAIESIEKSRRRRLANTESADANV